jgi:hypothetical protein
VWYIPHHFAYILKSNYEVQMYYFSSLSSSVSIVTRLRDRRPWFDFRQGLQVFLLATASLPALGPTQPPIQSVPWIKRPGREADHSPPPSAEVKNAWSYTSTPPYIFMVWCLMKQWIRPRGAVLS